MVAKIDGKTTNICRSLHLRILPLRALKAQHSALLGAKSIDQAKRSSDLSLTHKGVFSATLPPNVGIPPYHFGCRTFLRSLSAAEVKRTKVDEWGRAYQVRKEAWQKIRTKNNHLKGSRYKSVDELLGETLGNISREGVHKHDDTKRVILGRNGFMAFIDKDGYVETIFKATRRGYYEDYAPFSYFDKAEHSFNLMQKVKKWLGL